MLCCTIGCDGFWGGSGYFIPPDEPTHWALMVTQMALIQFSRSQARQNYMNRGKKLEVTRVVMRERERNRTESNQNGLYMCVELSKNKYIKATF